MIAPSTTIAPPVHGRNAGQSAHRSNTPAIANMGPSGEIAALAVGFGHLVPEDTIAVERRVETASGNLTYQFPLAGLASWLCLKSDAIMRRDKAKDAYDVVWTLDALGPAAASDRVASSPLVAGDSAGELEAQLTLLVADQFRDIDSVGPYQLAHDRLVAGAASGLIAAGAALGVAELIAAFFPSVQSPVLSVGNVVVDNVPNWAKDFAIRTFGENDKTALIIGTTIFLFLFAAVIGAITTKRRIAAPIGAALFGICLLYTSPSPRD